jgi:hypothetical protein
MYEAFCDFSIDREAFLEWLKKRQVLPLQPKEWENEQRVLEEQRAIEEQKRLEEEERLAAEEGDPTKKKKKDDKKKKKKTEEELEEERLEELRK